MSKTRHKIGKFGKLLILSPNTLIHGKLIRVCLVGGEGFLPPSVPVHSAVKRKRMEYDRKGRGREGKRCLRPTDGEPPQATAGA